MAEAHEQQSRVLRAMRSPAFYPDGPDAVEVRETHSSTVFLAGDRAYKVKKPVALPFLDYSTLARRRFFCLEEVRLNRRLAPEFYLGVRSVVDRDAQPALSGPDDPAAIEYVVEMLRVPEDHTLESLVASGGATEAAIEEVARRIAAFHADASPAPAGRGGPGEIAAQASENLVTVLEQIGPCVDEQTFAAVARFTAAWIRTRRELLRERVARGRVRDGHGDLRAEHVLVLDDGVVAYDCIEFDERLRQIDVASDLAFLYMDLERLGAPRLASRLRDAYVRESGDDAVPALLPFYACYRAWVRGKVACLRAAQLADDGPERRRLIDEARSLFELARLFTWQARLPLVVVLCGVGASGKSALASGLAGRSRLAHLSSDAIRKELTGVPLGERAPASAYEERVTMRVYERLALQAKQLVGEGAGVIADATFMKRNHRAQLLEALQPSGVRVLFAECTAPPSLLRERSSTREQAPEHGSDATWAVVREQLERFESLYDVPASDHRTVRTDRPLGEALDEVERFVAGALD